MEKENRGPVKVFSCGGVKAAIWADSRLLNDTIVEMHSIKVDRSFKDKDSDEWKSTNAFNCEDLPKVALVAMEAYKFIRLRSPQNDMPEDA